MKTKKRLSVIFICLAVVFCLGCAFALTACGGEDDSEENLTYKLNSDADGYIVSATSTDVKKVKIPSEHEGLPVTQIAISGFESCTSLTSITIPDTVITIGRNAFYNCMSLTSITIPDSVTTVGQYAFKGCIELKSVTIGCGLKSIDTYVFEDCWSMTSVTLSASTTSIVYYAFSGCVSLTDVYFKGTYAEWDNISIGRAGNEYFESATVHFI